MNSRLGINARKEIMGENKYFTSERLIYRPYCMEDLQTVHAQFNEQSRRRWFYFQEPDCLTVEFAERIIRNNIAVCSREANLLKDEFHLAVVLKDTGELIGSISLSKFHGPECELDNVEISWLISENHQNKGYATEVAKAAIPWAFSEMKKLGAEEKIISTIEHENWPSRRVAEKAGLTFVRAEKYVSVYEISNYILGG